MSAGSNGTHIEDEKDTLEHADAEKLYLTCQKMGFFQKNVRKYGGQGNKHLCSHELSKMKKGVP